MREGKTKLDSQWQKNGEVGKQTGIRGGGHSLGAKALMPSKSLKLHNCWGGTQKTSNAGAQHEQGTERAKQGQD